MVIHTVLINGLLAQWSYSTYFLKSSEELISIKLDGFSVARFQRHFLNEHYLHK